MKTIKVATKALITTMIAWFMYGIVAMLFLVDTEKLDTLSSYLQNFNTISSLYVFLAVIVGFFLLVSFFVVVFIYYIWTEWWK